MTTYPTPPTSRPHPAGPRLHTPPAPGYVPAGADGVPAGWVPFDPVASSIRNQVISRLLRMNMRHATYAWTHRRDQPVAPHAIAFLYAQPTPAVEGQPQHFRVLAATRMINDDPGVRDLPRLLYRLTALARERYLPTPGGFDPAVHMATHRDPGTGQAGFVGAGVSTLDTPAASWDEVQRTGADPNDVPGRCYAVLADNTAILIDRGAPRLTFGEVSIRATADLNVAPGLAGRMWIHHPDVSSMPASADVWQRLYELHTLTIRQPHRPTL